MMNKWISLLVISAFCLCGSALADSYLEPFDKKYKMTLSGISVTAHRSLEQLDDGNYLFRLKAKNLISRYEEKSLFKVDDTGQMYPLEHSVKSRVLGVPRHERTVFDWETATATYTKKDTVRTTDIKPGHLDRVLYQLLVSGDLNSGKTELAYDFIDRGRLKTYEFEIVAEETVELKKAEVNAVRINRVNQRNKDKETHIWFAPENGYELIKISHIDKDGSDYHLELKDAL